jgi:hypothetical protein
MRDPKRGPRKPIRAHVPGPTVEYSQRGRRIVIDEPTPADPTPAEKPTMSKRSKHSDEDFGK